MANADTRKGELWLVFSVAVAGILLAVISAIADAIQIGSYGFRKMQMIGLVVGPLVSVASYWWYRPTTSQLL
jgi:hypothetical protein